MSINVCNNNSMSAITSLPSGVGGGSLNLISTQTASSSSTISFASGIDSTYKEYIVKFFDVHPATDNNTSTNYFEVNLEMVQQIMMLLKLQLFLEHIILKMLALKHYLMKQTMI